MNMTIIFMNTINYKCLGPELSQCLPWTPWNRSATTPAARAESVTQLDATREVGQDPRAGIWSCYSKVQDSEKNRSSCTRRWQELISDCLDWRWYSWWQNFVRLYLSGSNIQDWSVLQTSSYHSSRAHDAWYHESFDRKTGLGGQGECDLFTHYLAQVTERTATAEQLSSRFLFTKTHIFSFAFWVNVLFLIATLFRPSMRLFLRSGKQKHWIPKAVMWYRRWLTG